MIRYEREILLQALELTKEQNDQYVSFLEATGLTAKINSSNDYSLIASAINENDSLDALVAVLDWLEKEKITYKLLEINKPLNYEGSITYDVVKNILERDKQIDAEMDYGLENDDDFFDSPFDNDDINKLGQQIIDMIPTKWEHIYFLSEVEAERLSISAEFYFQDAKTKEFVLSHDIPKKYTVSEEIYEDLMDELYDLVLNVYDKKLNLSGDVWDQLTMEIDAELNFKINFGYHTLEGPESQVERRSIWAYQTFGLTPDKGDFGYVELQKYITDNKLSNLPANTKSISAPKKKKFFGLF